MTEDFIRISLKRSLKMINLSEPKLSEAHKYLANLPTTPRLPSSLTPLTPANLSNYMTC